MANTHKPYPCGVVLFPVIDACLELRERNPGLSLDAITSITVEGHSLLRERADRPAVTTGREAQVSAQHSVAAVLIHGAAGIAQYEDACVNSAEVLALRKKVQVARAAGNAGRGRARDDHARGRHGPCRPSSKQGRGTPKRPMSDAEIEAKVRELARYGCPALDPGPADRRGLVARPRADAGAIMQRATP